MGTGRIRSRARSAFTSCHAKIARLSWWYSNILRSSGVHVVASTETELAPEAPAAGPEPGVPTAWWMHFGFTGPALFVRPADGAAIVLLLHRLGPSGEMLSLAQLQARRWCALSRFLG